MGIGISGHTNAIEIFSSYVGIPNTAAASSTTSGAFRVSGGIATNAISYIEELYVTTDFTMHRTNSQFRVDDVDIVEAGSTSSVDVGARFAGRIRLQQQSWSSWSTRTILVYASAIDSSSDLVFANMCDNSDSSDRQFSVSIDDISTSDSGQWRMILTKTIGSTNNDRPAVCFMIINTV